MHFQNVVAGFTAQDEEDLVDLRLDLRPHPDTQAAASPKAAGHIDKGKHRASVERDADGNGSNQLSPRSRAQDRTGRSSTSSRRHRKDVTRRS